MTVEDRAGMPTLHSYVPQLVARRLVTVPAALDESHADHMAAALLLIDISGFTSVTEAAVRRGAIGTEELSRSLNAYLGQVIELIAAHGGDVVKIVGDALIPMWPADGEDLATVSRRAAVCGMAVARELDELEIEQGRRLSVKVGICAGEVVTSRVGGLDDKWLFVVSGEAVAQLAGVSRRMLTGSVVASPEAWAVMSTHFVGEPIDAGYALVRRSHQEPEPRPLPTAALSVDQEAAVRAYIPEVSLSRLDAGQGEWLAELRRTTVIFANVRLPGAGPSHALSQLQSIAIGAQRATRRYDGWLKEITVDEKGTTLVAAFGVPPFSHEDDATRAIGAAIAIRAEIEAAGASAGIGVATGSAFCGPVGNALRRDFVVLGQHVNLAARLMQTAGEGAVLCDLETHDDANGPEVFERLPPYVLKGMDSPIAVFRVSIGEVPVDRPPDIVDRTRELEIASAALGSLANGTGGLVVVEGEPGIGKSRLTAEIARRARTAGVRTLIGRAEEIDGSTPYNAWRAIFEQLTGLDAVRDPTLRRTIVLDRLGGDEGKLSMAPLLDPVLSLDLPDNTTTVQLSGAVRADNTRDLLVDLLREEASAGPMMLVVEDAHWLDSASWSLLDRVRRDIPSVLVIVTMRPHGGPEAAGDRLLASATVLRLVPLEPGDGFALACQRTGADRLSTEVAGVIQQRADGNPLFIEQLTYAMRDAGRIVVENGLCRAAQDGGLEAAIIPDTVQRVITTRLDQLPPSEAMTLKVASVIGQRFTLQTLSEIHPVRATERTLLDHLQTLTRLDLVEPVAAAPSPTYEFRHVITQEVAYNLMLSEQSRELHRRLAEWHERTYAADLAPFHATMAHHWRRAGSSAQAVDHLERAGEGALRTFANEEAIGFLEQAVALEQEARLGLAPERRGRWQLQLGEAHVNMSRYHEGRQHLEEGLSLLGQPVPRGKMRPALRVLGEVLRQALRRAGIIRGERRLTAAERADLVAACRAFSSLAEASYYDHDTLLPLYCVIRNLNEAEAAASQAEIAGGLAGTGALFGLIPLPRIAEWYLTHAIARLKQVDDLPTHEFVEITVGFYYIGAARWDVARERFRSVRRTARRLGDRRRLDDALANETELEYLQGNLRVSLERANELVASAAARADRRYEAEGLAGRAYCAWLLGAMPVALDSLERIRTIMSRETELTDELRLQYYGALALISASRGEEAQALAASEEALRLTADTRPAYYGTFLGYVAPADLHLQLWERGSSLKDPRRAGLALARLDAFAKVFPIGRPRSRLLAGRHAWLLGRPGPAMRAFESALAAAEELDMPYEAALAHQEIGRRLHEGDPARAAHLEQGRQILGRIGVAQPDADADA